MERNKLIPLDIIWTQFQIIPEAIPLPGLGVSWTITFSFQLQAYLSLLCFASLCFTDAHFLQIESETLHQHKDYNSDCDTGFIAVGWNQIHNICEVCLYLRWVFYHPQLKEC